MSVEAEVQATWAAPSSVDPSPEEASEAKLGLSFLTTFCYPGEKTDPGCLKDRENSVADYGSILWPPVPSESLASFLHPRQHR